MQQHTGHETNYKPSFVGLTAPRQMLPQPCIPQKVAVTEKALKIPDATFSFPFFLMCMCFLLPCMSVHPGTGVTDGYEVSCRC